MDSYLGARRELDRERANELGRLGREAPRAPALSPKRGADRNYDFNILFSLILRAPALALAQAREPAVGE